MTTTFQIEKILHSKIETQTAVIKLCDAPSCHVVYCTDPIKPTTLTIQFKRTDDGVWLMGDWDLSGPNVLANGDLGQHEVVSLTRRMSLGNRSEVTRKFEESQIDNKWFVPQYVFEAILRTWPSDH